MGLEQWLMTVIPAAYEMEIERIMALGYPRQNVSKFSCQKSWHTG